MRLYNLEFFKPDITYRSSCQVADREYSEDYLSPGINKVKIPETVVVKKRDYILITPITSQEESQVGVITAIQKKDAVQTISYKAISSLMDLTMYENQSLLSSQTIEDWLAAVISDNFINNADTLQNITGLTTETISSTNGTFDYSSNINKFMTVISDAFLVHDVVISYVMNVQNKTIVAQIGKIDNTETLVIESDLPNILEKNFIIKDSKESINKIEIINQENENQKINYYLLSDGTISTTGSSDRITPVVPTTAYVSWNNESQKTWAEVTLDKATSTLKAQKYNNLIELTMSSEDELVKPDLIPIGRTVHIIKDNVNYETVLTGKEVKSGKTTLTFGAIRLELTKIIKRRDEQ